MYPVITEFPAAVNYTAYMQTHICNVTEHENKFPSLFIYRSLSTIYYSRGRPDYSFENFHKNLSMTF